MQVATKFGKVVKNLPNPWILLRHLEIYVT